MEKIISFIKSFCINNTHDICKNYTINNDIMDVINIIHRSTNISKDKLYDHYSYHVSSELIRKLDIPISLNYTIKSIILYDINITIRSNMFISYNISNIDEYIDYISKNISSISNLEYTDILSLLKEFHDGYNLKNK